MSNVNKPQRKIFLSLDIKPKRVIKEFRVIEENLLEVGTTLNVSHFQKNGFSNFSITKKEAKVAPVCFALMIGQFAKTEMSEPC